MKITLGIGASFLLALPQRDVAEPAPARRGVQSIESRVSEVTVYGGSAVVERSGRFPAGGGKLVLQGLPAGLEPDSVRVRAEGGEVVQVEVRERVSSSAPDARVQELREAVKALRRERARMDDEAKVLATLRAHVERLLAPAAQEVPGDGARATPEAWETNAGFLGERLGEIAKAERESRWKREDLVTRLADAELALGRESGAGVAHKDVIVDVVDARGQGGALEVEYLIGGCGWRPYYDLRAKKDLAGVELVYRAEVWQKSGEDWRDCALLLSTARPERGAQGPRPEAEWLALRDPRSRAPATGLGDDGRLSREQAESLDALGYAGDTAVEAERKVFAEVAQEGLSVRFRLPRAETIESRDDVTNVLVGRSELAIEPEHVVVPALDTTAWLRARAKNTSGWIMLPGRASVYFGADFVGHAQVAAVQLGQEFTVHLGADPGVVVKRTALEDLASGPGVFGSKRTRTQRWRIELENHGAFSKRADGSIDLIVHETLPKVTDERIEVSLEEATPKPVEGERWKKLREELGVLTWIVRPAKGKVQTIEWEGEVAWPETLELVERE
jgi:uncharacterized protein (TIGR02231 family)